MASRTSFCASLVFFQLKLHRGAAQPRLNAAVNVAYAGERGDRVFNFLVTSGSICEGRAPGRVGHVDQGQVNVRKVLHRLRGKLRNPRMVIRMKSRIAGTGFLMDQEEKLIMGKLLALLVVCLLYLFAALFVLLATRAVCFDGIGCCSVTQ